jgi:hypothetical protein
MIVTDVLTLNVPCKVFDAPLHVAINPEYRGKYLAIQLQLRGFKRAAVVTPKMHEMLGTYDSIIEFAERWLFNDFGYSHCQITTA